MVKDFPIAFPPTVTVETSAVKKTTLTTDRSTSLLPKEDINFKITKALATPLITLVMSPKTLLQKNWKTDPHSLR